MKTLKVLFLVGSLGVMFASCGSHRGTMCPAYATDTDSSVEREYVAVAATLESESLN
jgi:hypothetical protein